MNWFRGQGGVKINILGFNPRCYALVLIQICLTSSGESSDVRDDSERCRWPDGLWSASVSYGWMGRHWIWPDSEHTAMEVSLREGLMVGQSKSRGRRKCKIYLVLLCISLWTDAHSRRGPAFRTWNCISFFSSSLSLSLFLSIVWVNWESYRITAWQFLPVVWFLIITFIFLFWKKKMTRK